MMRVTPHAVVFDVEGTLVDCVPQTLACWQEVLARHGHRFSVAELHRYSGMDGRLMLSRLVPDIDHPTKKKLLKEQGELYREKYLPSAKPFPGARVLFEMLAGDGHRLGIATSCGTDELRFYLRLLDIADFVTAAVCGSEVEHQKPAPDLVQVAMARLFADRLAGTFMVGDTPYDAQAALAAGGKPIGTLGGGFTTNELKQAGCVAVASDLADLLTQMRDLAAVKPVAIASSDRSGV